MKAAVLCVLACLASLFSGCKLDGPLTEKPTRAVDAALVGGWFSLKDGSPMDVYRVSENEFLVIDSGQPYLCTHSDLRNTAFVSCRVLEEGSSHGKYAYVAYRIENNELRLALINYRSLGFDEDPESSEAVRKALEKAAQTPEGIKKHLEEESVFRKKS